MSEKDQFRQLQRIKRLTLCVYVVLCRHKHHERTTFQCSETLAESLSCLGLLCFLCWVFLFWWHLLRWSCLPFQLFALQLVQHCSLLLLHLRKELTLMPNANDLQLNLDRLNGRFRFDRIFGIVVMLVGVLLSYPLMIWLASGIFFMAAWDSIQVRRAEKLIAQHEENHPSTDS